MLRLSCLTDPFLLVFYIFAILIIYLAPVFSLSFPFNITGDHIKEDLR